MLFFIYGVLERFPIRWNRKAAPDLCLVAFSRREVVSTSLENALVMALAVQQGCRSSSGVLYART